jgi:hypothetical protein
MRPFLPLLLAFVLPGCGILGISTDEAAEKVAEIRDGLEDVKTAISNARRMDEVREAVAGIVTEIATEDRKVAESLSAVLAIFAKENPTEDDAKAAKAHMDAALASVAKVGELCKTVDATFGDTKLSPEAMARLKKLGEYADRTIQEMEKTAARVEKVAAVITKIVAVGGNVAAGVGAGPGILGVITMLGTAAAAAKTVAGGAKGSNTT